MMQVTVETISPPWWYYIIGCSIISIITVYFLYVIFFGSWGSRPRTGGAPSQAPPPLTVVPPSSLIRNRDGKMTVEDAEVSGMEVEVLGWRVIDEMNDEVNDDDTD